MKKRVLPRVLSCILALVMLLSMVPVLNISAASVEISDTGATLENGFWYEIQDGEAVITDYTSDATELVIPAELGGYPVTTIGEGAFLYCTTLKSVVIPDGVTSIGDGAFANCLGLESIEIANSVTSMGIEVFRECFYLANIILSENITEIPDNAFHSCYSLTSIVIPEGVTRIGNYAFYYCDALESITLPASLTTVGEYAFDSCVSLTEVHYTGTQEQWKQISVESYNSPLADSAVNYDGETTETEPAQPLLIYFIDVMGWENITLYYECYGDESPSTREMEWDSVNENEENIYVQSVPADAELIYFVSDSGAKTVFIYSFSDGTYFYCSDEIATGVYNVDTFEEDTEEYEPETEYVTGTIFESEHNYASDIDKTWIIEEEGASSIVITFSEDTNVEEDWDYIRIYDGNDELIGEYTGTALASQSVTVSGSVAKVQLISDSSNEYYGFYAEYEAIYGEITDPTESVPVETDPTEPSESEPVETDPTESVPVETDPTTPSAVENYYVAFVNYNNSLIEVQIVEEGMSAIAPEAPTRNGYYFVGWDTEFDCVTENLIVTAVFEISPVESTPTFPDGFDPYSVDVSEGSYPVFDGFNTVVFPANDWEEAYIYVWESGTSNAMATWPGIKMKFALINEYGENQFVAYIPECYDYCIINDGKSDFLKTVDLNLTTSIGFYLDDIQVDEAGLKSYTVGTWEPWFYDYIFDDSVTDSTEPSETDPVETDPTESVPVETEPTPTFPDGFDPYSVDVSSGSYPEFDGYNTVVFSAVNGWTEAYIYVWESGTSNAMATWPGIEMKYSLTNEYSQYQFVAYIPECYDCCIISNDQYNLQQTVDINLTSSTGLYAATKQDDKYTVGTWTPDFYYYEIDDSVTDSTESTDSDASLPYYEGSIDGLLYVVENTEVAIIDYEGDADEVVVPSKIDGYPVTSLDDMAFSCENIKKITLPEYLQTIGDYAFDGCHSLKEIVIPDSVKTIGNSAFFDCRALTSVTIPDSVTSIGNSVFECCYFLREVVFPEGLTSIGEAMFLECPSLLEVTIPASVTSIANGAFGTCENLSAVYYGGTQAQWEKISIGAGNSYLHSANIYYAYTCLVVFLDYNNNFIDAQMVAKGTAAVAPEAPTRNGYTFVGWDTEFDCVTENLTVKAVYEKNATPPSPAITTGTLKIEVAGGNGFTISVDGGKARPQGATYRNSQIPVGANVTVTANQTPSAVFCGWINSMSGTVVSTDPTYTFVASGNDVINAMYSIIIDGVQMVTFKNTKSDTYGRVLDSQYYAADDSISFPAAPTQVGFDFAGWSMTEEEIKAAIANGEDVTVVANWTRQIVPVQVTVNGGTGSGTYNANSAVTAVANEAPEGEKFAYWTDANGNIKSYSQTYKFFPSTDTTVTAVFVAEDTEVEYEILVGIDSIDTTTVETKNVFYYSWYCPEEYTFVKAGILAVNKDNYNESTFVAGTDDGNVYDRSPSGTIESVGSTFWTKSNVASGQTWVAKAYVQYKDAQGNILTVYSDVAEATKD